jgi:hypothetical protein
VTLEVIILSVLIENSFTFEGKFMALIACWNEELIYN